MIIMLKGNCNHCLILKGKKMVSEILFPNLSISVQYVLYNKMFNVLCDYILSQIERLVVISKCLFLFLQSSHCLEYKGTVLLPFAQSSLYTEYRI